MSEASDSMGVSWWVGGRVGGGRREGGRWSLCESHTNVNRSPAVRVVVV